MRTRIRAGAEARGSYGWSLLALVVIQWLVIAAVAAEVGHSSTLWIVIPQVVVLMPLTLVLVVEAARRFGPPTFAAWAGMVWIALPFVGVPYANRSFRHEYSHEFLPRLLGLADDPRTPAMACLAAALLFTIRAVETNRRRDVGIAVVAGAACAALAPPVALVALVPIVGLAVGGRRRAALESAVALVVLGAALWAGVAAGPLSGPFVHVDFHAAGRTLSSLSEDFWSGRVLEWLAIAGVAGAIRGNRSGGAMTGFAFLAAFFSLRLEARPAARNLELLHALLPAWPVVVLAVASLPLLWPRVHAADRRVGASPTPAEPSGSA
jgi:hypothetical protein